MIQHCLEMDLDGKLLQWGMDVGLCLESSWDMLCLIRTRRPAWFLKMVEDQWNLKARRRKKKASRNATRRS
jgi:hypothetical protein